MSTRSLRSSSTSFCQRKAWGAAVPPKEIADHLTALVDRECLADQVARERLQVLAGGRSPSVQKKACAMNVALGAFPRRVGESDHVTLLVDVHRRVPGRPPRVGRVSGLPFRSHRTARSALKRPTPWSQRPEIPTACPASLMAVAADAASPGQGGNSRALIFALLPGLSSQIAARKPSTCLSTQVDSGSAVSPQPTICPWPFTPVAKL